MQVKDGNGASTGKTDQRRTSVRDGEGGVSAYYNENDKFAAAWLRELIKAGLIANGEVDERSIEEVKPDELRGFKQCHFFAGIGVWSYALRNAGWSDDSPVWTGSCPCQSFSASGKGEGFSDKRHLWPTWFRLISECRPVVCFGEQVASKDGLAWFDVVSSDMEGAGYSIGATDLCAAGFGAPHIRQRLYFVADSERSTVNGKRGELLSAQGQESGRGRNGPRRGGETGDMAHANGSYRSDVCGGQRRGEKQRGSGDCSELGDTNKQRPQGHGRPVEQHGAEGRGRAENAATPSFWANAEWIYCRDGKHRPVEPGTFPLAHGATNRVGRLRGYGNAINAQVAQGFIEAYMSAQ